MKFKTLFKAFYLVFTFGLLCRCSNDDGPNSPIPNTSNGDLDFIVTYGGTKNESAQSVTATQDGGYAILGYTQSIDGDITDRFNENFDFWVLKYNADNSIQWSKTYGGSLDDRGNDIIQTSDGGFAILGFSSSSDEDVTENAGAQDYWITKLDVSGNISWQHSYGYSGLDSGISLIQTTDNGFLMVGVLDVTASGGAGNSKLDNKRHAGGDYWAIKLDAIGNEEWRKYFGGSFTDTPSDVIQTENGYLIIGSSDSDDVDITNSNGSYDFWLIKISTTGILQWEKSYGGQEIDEAWAITNSGDGNFLIVGDTRSNDQDVSENNGAADLWLIKINPTGTLLWEKSFGGSSFDVGRSVSKTFDDGFIISGSSRSSDGDLSTNKGQNDAWVLKVDNEASIEWQHTFGGTDIDFAYDATELLDGSSVIVGESNSSDGDIPENKGFTDLLIIKLK